MAQNSAQRQAPGTIRAGPGPSDDRPPEPHAIQGDECPGCRDYRAPGCWYPVHAGTLRGDALGLEGEEVINICPRCEKRLRDWLRVDDEPESGGKRRC